MVLCGPLARVKCKWVSFWSQNKTMLGALVIVFREVIEAGLIVGIVMAATRGVAGRGRWVGFGILAGVLGAAVVAIFAGVISQAFEGAGQELFNASVLGLAVVMLMWHNAWMARHGREIAEEMLKVGAAVSKGAKPLTALAIVVGLAVLREGSEVVLFLNNAGVVVALDRTVWDTSWLLSDGSLFGKLLHTLIGYTERPTEMQLMTYIATLFAMFLLMRLARPAPREQIAA